MTNKELKISYSEYASIDELEASDKALVEAAINSLKGSYAPYSMFNVGAAVRMSNGQVFTGANQENAAYPSGLCAERTAMFYANAQLPEEYMESLAIVASKGGVICESPATPCGQCRQVMAEYQTKGGHPVSIILAGSKCVWKFHNVESVLPFIFDSLDK